MREKVLGKIHSIQSLGTLDGPGVRFVIFTQGCPLRCKCCHNPDTWAFDGGESYSPEQLIEKAERFREYFGADGGVTLSGGEPLAQAEFSKELFRLAKEKGINTCLDTSGCLLNGVVKEVLEFTDRVLLDIKYTTDAQYLENVGCGMDKPLEFLDYLSKKGIKTTIRQVIIPTKNDDEKSVLALKEIARARSNVDKIELLPFRKICAVKYKNLKIDFPFKDVLEPTKERMRELEKLL